MSIQNPYQNPLQPYEMYYAQAVYMIDHGFEYWFDQEHIQTLAPHVESFMTESNEEELLPIYFAPAQAGETGAKFMTTAELSARLAFLGNLRNPLSIRKLGELLRKIGYQQVKHSKLRVRGYVVRELDTNTLDENRKNLAGETPTIF
ncbi:MAG: hypothetical protein MJZ64_02415 [Paludibacteraceae bacterium]|nr:hypothetical protein [Paludibacteraceae bacterium]